MLHPLVIVERQLLRRTVEHLQQARDAIEARVGVLEHQRRRVAGRIDVVIGRRDEAARWIQLRGQILPEPLPLVLAGTGDRQPSGPAFAQR